MRKIGLRLTPGLYFGAICFLILSTAFYANPASAYEGEIPPLPASYYGSVNFSNGDPVPAGTIKAYIDGVKRGELSFTGGFYANELGPVKLTVQGPSEILGLPVTFVVVINNQSYQALPDKPVIMESEVVKRVDLTVIAIPTVHTNTATNITPSSATLNGSIIEIGIEACDKVKFVYKVQETPTWQETAEKIGTYGLNATFYDNLSSLTAETTFEYKAMAHNSAGWSGGTVSTFTTLTSPPCAKGDVDDDSFINVQDVVRTVNIILGKFTPTAYERCAADVNNDERINVQDVVRIVNTILGKI